MDNKISIRFYKNREVRAVWDGEGNKWWFSVLDVIGVMNEQDDYAKNRNYWTSNPQLRAYMIQKRK